MYAPCGSQCHDPACPCLSCTALTPASSQVVNLSCTAPLTCPALPCRSANVSPTGVPQPTDCTINCNSGGGAFTMLTVTGFRGADPSNALPTDLRTVETDPFLGQE